MLGEGCLGPQRVLGGELQIFRPGSHSHHRTLASCLPALGQGQGADCHELGQDAVSPEKPVEAAIGEELKTQSDRKLSARTWAGGQDLILPDLLSLETH